MPNPGRGPSLSQAWWSTHSIGPNIKYLPGRYWDFWDHYIPLTEESLREVLELAGFEVERCIAKFMPYQMVRQKRAPLPLVRLYLKLPWVWHFSAVNSW